MDFGKYAIVQPTTVSLEEEPGWTWTFKPVMAKDELELQGFLTHGRRITIDGRTETRPATIMEIVFEELSLSYGGTTIPQFKRNEDGEWAPTDKPILTEKASKEEVKRVLGQMPVEMVLELWRKLGEIIPNWGPLKDNPKA